MIFVLYPPGCYGSYVGKSLYHYTDLSPGPTIDFTFDSSGSSHSIRQDTDLKKKIKVGHQLLENCTQVVSVLPLQDHWLDYFNNQFAKNYNSNINKYIRSLSVQDDLISELKNWGLECSTVDSAPRCILREFFSFWLTDCFANGYNAESYLTSCSIVLSTHDIFQDFYNTILKTSDAFGLTVKASKLQIESNHASFLRSQLFHNSQLNCADWVRKITTVGSVNDQSPCQTIFDEAYVQHLLRTAGYELKCDGLDIFPTTSTEMQSLIYKQ
jgi:hypothetical protein